MTFNNPYMNAEAESSTLVDENNLFSQGMAGDSIFSLEKAPEEDEYIFNPQVANWVSLASDNTSELDKFIDDPEGLAQYLFDNGYLDNEEWAMYQAGTSLQDILG